LPGLFLYGDPDLLKPLHFLDLEGEGKELLVEILPGDGVRDVFCQRRPGEYQ